MLSGNFHQEVMEGSDPDAVSLLQQEIANLCLQIQAIKAKINKFSSPQTQEEEDKLQYWLQQLDKVREVHKGKVDEFQELQSELL